MWNIKKIVSKGDYYYAVVPEHPKKTKNNYVLLHRVVMENHLGRLLNTNEIVHHIDGNKKNNSISNLQVMTAKEHNSHHGKEQGKWLCELICPWCKKQFTLERRKTHLIRKKHKYTCCSASCRGSFSRNVQLHGITHEVESAISVNIQRLYHTLDNTEGTHLQETP